MLGRLRFDDEVLEWVRDALHSSHADERREHEEAIKRLEAEAKRLNDRIHAMYVDKLDGLGIRLAPLTACEGEEEASRSYKIPGLGSSRGGGATGPRVWRGPGSSAKHGR